MTRVNLHVGTRSEMPRPANEYRYGIFIRPPADVALPALVMMDAARDLFGFHAASAYPPHITLIGSIVLAGTEDELGAAIDAALNGHRAIPVNGSGLDAEIGAAVGIDYTLSSNGTRNAALIALYEDLRRETEPVRGYEPTDRKAEHRREREGKEHFRAHLTVLGHDGADDLDLRDEAHGVLTRLAADVPPEWTADTITLYRFWSAEWDAKYWLTQEWVPLRSWSLGR